MTPLIDAHALTAGYPTSSDVLHDLSFTLDRGRVHGLIGPNGTGKTTLLRVLAGQLAYTGELSVFGAAPFDNPAVMDRAVLAGIDAPLPAQWSVNKLLAVGAARYPTWDAERAAELVARFHLPGTTRYSAMSRGQKSAASIVFACASGCELLLLDEPYLGLDVEKRESFYLTLRQEMNRQPRTIVLSTHHLHELERFLDTVLFIDSGQVRINGPVEEIAEQIFEVAGPADQVERVLGRLGPVTELTRQDMALGRRSVIDLGDQPVPADTVFELTQQVGGRVRISEVTLEQAVLAMSKEKR